MTTLAPLADPQLLEAIEQRIEDPRHLIVVYTLRAGSSTPEQSVAEVVRDVMELAQVTVHVRAEGFNAFEHLNAFAVLAQARLHRQLLEDERIGTAMLSS